MTKTAWWFPILALLASIALYLCLVGARADDKPPSNIDPALRAWFASQHTLKGAWCCQIDDVHVLDTDEWSVAPDGVHYQVRIHDTWYAVPDDALRRPDTPNPTGKAVAWYIIPAPSNGVDGVDGLKPIIYCFAPGTLN
jgi:hypothetical protein